MMRDLDIAAEGKCWHNISIYLDRGVHLHPPLSWRGANYVVNLEGSEALRRNPTSWIGVHFFYLKLQISENSISAFYSPTRFIKEIKLSRSTLLISGNYLKALHLQWRTQTKMRSISPPRMTPVRISTTTCPTRHRTFGS